MSVSSGKEDDGKKPSAARHGASFRLFALGVFVLPAILVLLICVLAVFRHTAERNHLDATLAKVSSAWTADVVGLVGDEKRGDLVERTGASMGIMAGVVNSAGVLKSGELPGEINEEEMKRAVLGEVVSLKGTPGHLAVSWLKPPNSGWGVAVVVPMGNHWEEIAGFSWKFIPVVGLSWVLLAALLLLLGRRRTEVVEVAAARLRNLLAAEDARESTPVPELPTDLAPLEKSMERLSRDLRGRGITSLNDLGTSTTAANLKTELLHSVGLNLYRPLDAVVTLSERLVSGEDGLLEASQMQDVKVLLKAARKLREMVGEILDLSDIMTDEFELEFSRVDLLEISMDVAEVARGRVDARGLALGVICDQERVEVIGNRRRLWQVITNLMSNAIKFTEVGGVTIRVLRREDGAAEFSVEDSGVGIRDMDQSSVFDTFRQLPGAGNRKRGSGLGLAICRRLVELHNGRIGVSSVLGKGTKFTVVLPPIEDAGGD